MNIMQQAMRVAPDGARQVEAVSTVNALRLASENYRETLAAYPTTFGAEFQQLADFETLRLSGALADLNRRLQKRNWKIFWSYFMADNEKELANKSVKEPKRSFHSLPPEVRSQIVKELATPDPNETARNFNSFRRVDKEANILVKETPASRRFLGRVMRLGQTARDVFDAAIPKGALHEEYADQPGDTYSHVAVAASVQRFRPPAERAELVGKVSHLSHEFGLRAEASIPLIASEHTDSEHRNRLIADVIQSYNTDRGDHSGATNDELRAPALYALKEAHENNHLSEHQKAELPPGTLDRLKPDLWVFNSRPRHEEGRAFRDRLSEELNAAPDGKIDQNIRKLSSEFESLSRELPDSEDHSVLADTDRTEKFEKLEIIAKHVSKSYADALDRFRKDDPQRSSNEARGQLIENERSRDRQDRGR
ncbi:hypothetical protein N183_32780 [Sinorhizobium sp. Sb3]|uniref:hypothetical protein n=1 Tax=Sinorhizobium sp. Sb3 TaxID=1358417 RepID=UPI00071C39DB|nr:hypothetical protein [Sinorhizobium sp. Sb3]KSV66834.1 hypothetical protein N183_32780 [Sinorhizobium sp. Sb3]